MVSLPVTSTIHRAHSRSATPRPSPAYRRVYSRIRSNQSGSSFDTVRRIPVRTRDQVTYSRIRSDRPGTSYDTAHRTRVPQPEPDTDTRSAGRSVTGSIRSLLRLSVAGGFRETQVTPTRPTRAGTPFASRIDLLQS